MALAGSGGIEDKLEVMRHRIAAGKARWAGVSKRERAEQMRAVRGAGGGRQRSLVRCWCGKYTLATATVRGFDCCKRAGKYPGEKS